MKAKERVLLPGQLALFNARVYLAYALNDLGNDNVMVLVIWHDVSNDRVHFIHGSRTYRASIDAVEALKAGNA